VFNAALFIGIGNGLMHIIVLMVGHDTLVKYLIAQLCKHVANVQRLTTKKKRMVETIRLL
jgi:hypothetical protein